MSTLYSIDHETSTTVSANDQFPMHKTSTGRTMKVSGAAVRTYVLGITTSETLGFYGVTSVTQPTSSNQAAVATTATILLDTTLSATQRGYAFTTSTQPAAMITLLNQLRAYLVTLGLIKGS